MRQWRLLAHKEGTPHPNASRGEKHRNEEDCFSEIGVRYVGLVVVCDRLPGPLRTTVPHLHIVELGNKLKEGQEGSGIEMTGDTHAVPIA